MQSHQEPKLHIKYSHPEKPNDIMNDKCDTIPTIPKRGSSIIIENHHDDPIVDVVGNNQNSTNHNTVEETLITKGNSGENQQQNSNRKSVTFNEAVAVRGTIRLCDYTDEEIHNCWYNAFEQNKMYDDISNAVKDFLCMKKNGKMKRTRSIMKQQGNCRNRDVTTSNNDFSSDCLRGLEYFLFNGMNKQRQRRRSKGYLAVFEEQGLQWKEDTHHTDSNVIAYVYNIGCESNTALVEAQKAAQLDEAEVKKDIISALKKASMIKTKSTPSFSSPKKGGEITNNMIKRKVRAAA